MTRRIDESVGGPAPARVYVEVDSLEPVEAIRPAVVGWLDEIYRSTVAPLASALHMPCVLDLLAEGPPRFRRLRSERVWVEALAELASPAGHSLALIAGQDEGQGVTLEAELGGVWPASRLWITVEGEPVSAGGWPALRERLLAHSLAAAAATGASTGFIASDAGRGETPYERHTRRYLDQGLAESDRWLRGVFWCTLLSQRHLEVLGGREQVEREAPVAQAYRLDARSGPMLLLQASDDLADVDTATLAPLSEYLAPVLPPPTPRPTTPPRHGEPVPEPLVEIDADVDADVTASLTFRGNFSDADRAILDQLLDAWYLLAVHGVFGGSVHNMEAAAYDQSEGTTECTVDIDLGSAGVDALEPLVRLLVAASDEFSSPLLRIRVGEPTLE